MSEVSKTPTDTDIKDTKSVAEAVKADNAVIEPLIENDAPELGGLDDDDEEEKTFTILLSVSKDSEPDKYVLTQDMLPISNFISKSLEEDDSKEVELSATSITSPQLKLIVEYFNLCKLHNKSADVEKPPTPLKSKDMMECAATGLPKEVIEFVLRIRNDGGKRMIYDMINVCNYLDIQGLLHVFCASVASTIKGHPMETVKKILDPNDPETGESV
jgi:hypothetical protein